MSFIGIIAENKQEKYMQKQIKNNLKTSTVIKINENTIENMKNVTFDIILMIGNNKKISSKTESFKQMISKAKYLIINSDIETNLEMIDNLNVKVITFGFNSKSSITVSSVKEDSLLLCVQRTLITSQGKEIEPQEILIKMDTRKANIYASIATLIVFIIYEIKLESLS